MIVYLYLCQELSYCCVVCHYLRPKIVWIVWFQLVILSIVALFTIVWDRSSYMNFLMFYSLACLSFFRYRSHRFRSLSMYFPFDYYRFRNYRNIGAVFVFDNIVSISFSRKICENESDLASYRSFPIVFIPTRNVERGTVPRSRWLWRDLLAFSIKKRKKEVAYHSLKANMSLFRLETMTENS
jgi:hypothetical protein